VHFATETGLFRWNGFELRYKTLDTFKAIAGEYRGRRQHAGEPARRMIGIGQPGEYERWNDETDLTVWPRSKNFESVPTVDSSTSP
jgi:hypothetical protein